MTVLQPTQSPEGPALAALFATDDAMPEALHATVVYTQNGTAVVLVDDLDVWAAWIVAMDSLPGVHMSAQVGRHFSLAEGCVCGCPVMLVAGDLSEAQVAA
jgi:hypothetical protein